MANSIHASINNIKYFLILERTITFWSYDVHCCMDFYNRNNIVINLDIKPLSAQAANFVG